MRTNAKISIYNQIKVQMAIEINVLSLPLMYFYSPVKNVFFASVFIGASSSVDVFMAICQKKEEETIL